MTVEVWQVIPSSSGRYEASSLGRIRERQSGKLRPLRKRPSDGYIAVDVRYGGKRHTKTVNTLVCEAFNGPRPEGYCCAHLNGQPDDNRPENLRWVTPAENSRHRDLHGTMFYGEVNPQSKLTKSDVLDIRHRRHSGQTLQSIADDFGVACQTIDKIAKGTRWPHVGGPRTFSADK